MLKAAQFIIHLQNLYSEVAEKKVIESHFYVIDSSKISKVSIKFGIDIINISTSFNASGCEVLQGKVKYFVLFVLLGGL